LLWAQSLQVPLTITYPETQIKSQAALYALFGISGVVHGTHTVSESVLQGVPTFVEITHCEHGKQLLSFVPPQPPEKKPLGQLLWVQRWQDNPDL
jgi:hypothetical protein